MPENGNGNGSVLSLEQIDSLMAGSKVSKGTYQEKLVEILESDELAVDPAVQWPAIFGSKSPDTLYQSFNGAARKAEFTSDQVVVKKDDERCLVIVMANYHAAKELAASEA